jgi:F-type H+-transporting ATPase subunit gamma
MQITKAMKMVAAAKLRRAQENIVAARPYAHKIDEMLSHLAAKVDRSKHPLMLERPANKVCIVVVTADRGFCGAFNNSLIRFTSNRLNQLTHSDISLITVGRKGRDFFKKHGSKITGEHVNFFNELKFHHALMISGDIIQQYASGNLDRVEIIYNEFKSAIQQKIVNEQFLPIRAKIDPEEKTQIDYLYEPSQEVILETLLPRHLNIQMWRVLLESYAAEQGARMTAMDAATENAKEIISGLKLSYNRSRQAAITKELAEIVGGAEALK